MTRHPISVCTFLSLVLLAGCAGGHRASLPHPASTGSIAPATAHRGDFFAENRLHVERHSLTDDVTLVRLDAVGICVQAIVRSVEGEANVPDLSRSATVTLSIEDHALEPRWIDTLGPSSDIIVGVRYEEQGTGEFEMVCTDTNGNGDCIHYAPQEIFVTVALPMDLVRTTQTSLVCFANDGAITPASTTLELHIDRTHYGFNLDGAAAVGTPWPDDGAGHPRVIVAAGYEAAASFDATSGGATPGAAAASPAPLAPPADLAVLTVHPLRLEQGGRALIEVRADGGLVLDGHEGQRIEGGAMLDQHGLTAIALGRDGTVWALRSDRSGYEAVARMDDEGRVTMADEPMSFWVDRRGHLVRSRAGARPERANASIEGRLRGSSERRLAGLMLLLTADMLTWR